MGVKEGQMELGESQTEGNAMETPKGIRSTTTTQRKQKRKNSVTKQYKVSMSKKATE